MARMLGFRVVLISFPVVGFYLGVMGRHLSGGWWGGDSFDGGRSRQVSKKAGSKEADGE